MAVISSFGMRKFFMVLLPVCLILIDESRAQDQVADVTKEATVKTATVENNATEEKVEEKDTVEEQATEKVVKKATVEEQATEKVVKNAVPEKTAKVEEKVTEEKVEKNEMKKLATDTKHCYKTDGPCQGWNGIWDMTVAGVHSLFEKRTVRISVTEENKTTCIITMQGDEKKYKAEVCDNGLYANLRLSRASMVSNVVRKGKSFLKHLFNHLKSTPAACNPSKKQLGVRKSLDSDFSVDEDKSVALKRVAKCETPKCNNFFGSSAIAGVTKSTWKMSKKYRFMGHHSLKLLLEGQQDEPCQGRLTIIDGKREETVQVHAEGDKLYNEDNEELAQFGQTSGHHVNQERAQFKLGAVNKNYKTAEYKLDEVEVGSKKVSRKQVFRNLA